jgi:hypothetical protein
MDKGVGVAKRVGTPVTAARTARMGAPRAFRGQHEHLHTVITWTNGRGWTGDGGSDGPQCGCRGVELLARNLDVYTLLIRKVHR